MGRHIVCRQHAPAGGFCGSIAACQQPAEIGIPHAVGRPDDKRRHSDRIERRPNHEFEANLLGGSMRPHDSCQGRGIGDGKCRVAQ